MTTRRTKKSAALRFLERRAGGPLTLGRMLEAIRVGDEISQAEFARRLGVSRSHLCDIEHGRKSVSLTRAMRFAKVLGYPEDQFVRLALQAMVVEAGLELQVKIEAA
jgi:transcriptional regulator with XRE-family HTH domain